MNVLNDINDLLSEVDTTTERLAASIYAEAMASIYDLLDHAVAGRLGLDSAGFCADDPGVVRARWLLGLRDDFGVSIRRPPSLWDDEEEEVMRVGGTQLRNVHRTEFCGGGDCVIHNPSNHHMATWPLIWRDDVCLFERLCAHGTGHPDPDQFSYWRRSAQEYKAIHGCDGCCRP
jgi:hypothetical protein